MLREYHVEANLQKLQTFLVSVGVLHVRAHLTWYLVLGALWEYLSPKNAFFEGFNSFLYVVCMRQKAFLMHTAPSPHPSTHTLNPAILQQSVLSPDSDTYQSILVGAGGQGSWLLELGSTRLESLI